MSKQLENSIKEKINGLERETNIIKAGLKEVIIQAHKLGKQEKTKNSLVPEIKQEYWYINDDGYKLKNKWDDVRVDNERLARGNVYLTEQDCDKAIQKLKAIQTIKTYIAEHFSFEADWTDEEQKKYFIKYDYEDKKLDSGFVWLVKYYSPFGYLKSSEDCEQLIKDCEIELELIFKS